MTEPKFQTAKEAQNAGWYSRRHPTSDAHVATREHYAENRGKAGRIKRTRERTA